MIISVAQRWRLPHVQPTPGAVCSIIKSDVLLQASDGKGGLGWQLQQWLLQAVWVAGCCPKA
jgi:hypothetical protein